MFCKLAPRGGPLYPGVGSSGEGGEPSAENAEQGLRLSEYVRLLQPQNSAEFFPFTPGTSLKGREVGVADRQLE